MLAVNILAGIINYLITIMLFTIEGEEGAENFFSYSNFTQRKIGVSQTEWKWISASGFRSVRYGDTSSGRGVQKKAKNFCKGVKTLRTVPEKEIARMLIRSPRRRYRPAGNVFSRSEEITWWFYCIWFSTFL